MFFNILIEYELSGFPTQNRKLIIIRITFGLEKYSLAIQFIFSSLDHQGIPSRVYLLELVISSFYACLIRLAKVVTTFFSPAKPSDICK